MLKCKNCSVRFETYISDDSEGYRCPNCQTVHSWTTGKIFHVMPRLYRLSLGGAKQ
jgi:hypothetical protein